MLREPTVFVIGAGAGKDFDFPIGSELIGDIHRGLSWSPPRKGERPAPNDDYILRALRGKYTDIKPHVEAGHIITNSLLNFRSIDDFLHSHGHDERIKLMGKLAIARSISRYEQNSGVRKLWETSRPQEWFSYYKGKWIFSLVQLLVTGVTSQHPEDVFKNIAIVSFNYDRCIESILFHALQGALNLPAEKVANLLTSLRVYRPYGGLGDLRYDRRGEGVAFGDENPDLWAMASRIRVYTENAEEGAHLQEMRGALADAASVVFLGFGFHSQNMKILGLSAEKPKNIYATVFEQPHAAAERIGAMLAPLAHRKRPPFIGDIEKDHCAKFLHDHFMHLS